LRQYLVTFGKSCMLLESSEERWSSRHLLAPSPPRSKIATYGFHTSSWITMSCSWSHGCIALRPNNLFMFMFMLGLCWVDWWYSCHY
jgi:hypothetical protein